MSSPVTAAVPPITLQPAELRILHELADHLWDQSEEIAAQWSAQLMALRPSIVPADTTQEGLTALNHAFLGLVLRHLRAEDMVSLASEYYELNRQLVANDLFRGPASVITLDTLYASARLGIEVIARRLGEQYVEWALAYSKLSVQLLHLVARAYSDSREEYLQRSFAHIQTLSRLFQGVLEAAPDAMFIADHEQRIVLLNSAAEVLFGYARDALVGRPLRSVLHLNGHPSLPDECVGVRKDGSRLPVELRTSQLQTEDGTLLIHSIRDLTAHKTAERELQQAHADLEQRIVQRTAELVQTNEALQSEVVERSRVEERLRREKSFADTTLDSLPGIFYLFDERGSFLRWNHNFESVSGYTHDEIAQLHPLQLFEGSDRDHVADRITAVFAEGGATAEADLLSKTGRRTAHFFTGRRIVLDGRPCLVGMGIDVTERKQMMEELHARTAELARSNADLEQFAYVASHDLQEPLRAVASYTQLLARRYGEHLDGDARKFIERSTHAVGRMQALIHDLLAYSRVSTHGRAFQPSDCGIILNEALENLHAALLETHGSISCGTLPMVQGDTSQLRQLFQNLLANALKFRGNQPPQIQVTAERSASNWRFVIRDNGIGIDPTFAERIFVIFQRLHTRDSYPGTGVGLAICKKIVERHGGRIWVESEPDQGAAFYFTLPAA